MTPVQSRSSPPPLKGRLFLGGGVLVVGQLSPVFIPFVASSGLSTGAKAALRMIEMGADNLTIDEPGLLVNLRQQLRELSRAELIALALRTRFGP